MCDFGLARESDASMSQAFTEYVVTRWYRAPEVLLSGGRYTGSIDVWSVGCILGELLLRRPLFPGEHYLHQLQLITEILGSPSEEDLAFVTAPAARTFMVNLPKSPGVPFSTLFPHVRGPCLDLLRKMLIFEPSQRITVAEALEHPFLARVRAARRSISEESTPVPRPFKLRVHGGSSALKAMTVDKLKERFYAELCGLAMTPTPSTPSPHGATALFATLAGAGGGSSSSSGSGGGASGAGDLGSPPVHSVGGLGSLPRPAAALSPPQASKLGPSASTTARPHTSGALGALPGAGSAGNPLLPFGAAPRGMPGPLGYGPPRGQGSGAGAGAGGAVASAAAASLAAAATAGGLARGGGSVGVNVFLPRGGALPFPRVPGGIPAAAAVASPPKGASAASSSGEGSPGLLSSRYTAPGAAAPAPGERDFLRNRYGMGLVGGSSADTGAGAGAGSAPGSSRERSSRRGEEEEAEGEEEGEEEDDEEYGDEEDEYDYGDVEEGTRTLGGIKEASKEGSFDDSMVDSVEGLGAGGEGGEVVGGAPRVGAGVGASAPSRAGFSGMFGAPPPGPSALPPSYRQPSAAGAAASNAGGALSGLVGAPRSQAQAFLAAYGAGGTSLTPPRTTHTHAPSPPLGPPPPPPPPPASHLLPLSARLPGLPLPLPRLCHAAKGRGAPQRPPWGQVDVDKHHCCRKFLFNLFFLPLLLLCRAGGKGFNGARLWRGSLC